MMFYLVICTFDIVQINSFIIRDSYNILLKDSAQYKIEESLHVDDFEMIENNQLIRFSIADKENKFLELNKLASKEYDKNFKGPKRDWVQRVESTAVVKSYRDKETTSTHVPPVTGHVVHQRDITKDDSEQYDYDYLIEDYYAESINGTESNQTYHFLPAADLSDAGIFNYFKNLFDLKTDCNEDKNGIGVKAVTCLIVDYKSQQQSSKELAMRFWKITKSWLLVYLAVAAAFWCTKGWCCCCLCCQIFKPEQTIKNAKTYMITNPPGIYKSKVGKEMHYKPTECERECFEEFEHLMKTI